LLAKCRGIVHNTPVFVPAKAKNETRCVRRWRACPSPKTQFPWPHGNILQLITCLPNASHAQPRPGTPSCVCMCPTLHAGAGDRKEEGSRRRDDGRKLRRPRGLAATLYPLGPKGNT